MIKLISCEYNIDTVCVELKYSDGSMIAIDTIAVENEVADNMYQRSELDNLSYNAELEYVDVICRQTIKDHYGLKWSSVKMSIFVWNFCLQKFWDNIG